MLNCFSYFTIKFRLNILPSNYKVYESNKNKEANYTDKDAITETIIARCYYFWIAYSFCETIVFLTLFLLIETTNLNPNVHISLEIFLVSLINYIYSLSMLLSIFDDITNIENIKTIISIIPLIYNFLIYFVVIILPFLYGIFNNTVIIYDLPGELCTSLYLFFM